MLTQRTRSPLMVAPTTAGEGTNQRNAIGISAVFACVRALGRCCDLCPLVCTVASLTAAANACSAGSLPNLLDKPAAGVTRPALIAQLMCHLALWGECFAREDQPTGTIEVMEALSPDMVQVEIKRASRLHVLRPARAGVREPLDGRRGAHPGHELDGIRGSARSGVPGGDGPGVGADDGRKLDVGERGDARGDPQGGRGTGGTRPGTSLAKGWSERHGAHRTARRIAVVTGDVDWPGEHEPRRRRVDRVTEAQPARGRRAFSVYPLAVEHAEQRQPRHTRRPRPRLWRS